MAKVPKASNKPTRTRKRKTAPEKAAATPTADRRGHGKAPASTCGERKGDDSLDSSPNQLQWEISLFRAAGSFIRPLPIIASSFASLAIFAYMFGYVAWMSYLFRFNAAWLVSQIPHTSVMSFAILPLILMAFALYAFLDDTAAAASEGGSLADIIVRYGTPLAILLMISEASLEHSPTVSFLAGVCWIVLALLVAACVRRIVIHLRTGTFRWDLTDVRLAWAIIFLGLLAVPWQYGYSEGLQAADVSRSKLPVIHLVGQDDDGVRLLFTNGNKFYAVGLREHRNETTIHIIESEQVEMIVPFRPVASPRMVTTTPTTRPGVEAESSPP